MTVEAQKRSYTNASGQGLAGTLREFRDLYSGIRAASRQVPSDVKKQLEQREMIEQTYRRLTGRELKGLLMVEIGSGQSLRAARCFGQHNRVIATDLDAYADGFDIPAYLEIMRRNGLKRAVKTAGLRLLGNDRKFNRHLKRALGVSRLPEAEFRAMDATKLEFADNSIDLIYSFHVFEHLPEPEKVLVDAKRVLKPGGVIFTHLHLYTSDSGCHDLRIIRDDHSEIGFWPHLRPDEAPKIRNAAYLNEVRLDEWREMFRRQFGDFDVQIVRDDHLRPELDRLRAAGAFAGFSDDELLTRNLVVTWVKPTA